MTSLNTEINSGILLQIHTSCFTHRILNPPKTDSWIRVKEKAKKVMPLSLLEHTIFITSSLQKIFRETWIITPTALTRRMLEGRGSPSRHTELSSEGKATFIGKGSYFSHSFNSNFFINTHAQTPELIKLRPARGPAREKKKCHT